MICPKCGHERSSKDDPLIPDYQCPACGVIYAKVVPRPPTGPATFEVDESPRQYIPPPKKQQEQPINASVVKTSAATMLLFYLIGFAIVFSFIFLAPPIWEISDSIKRMLGMRPPEISISEILTNPEKVKEYKEDMCDWAKREERRNPSIMATAKRESACK